MVCRGVRWYVDEWMGGVVVGVDWNVLPPQLRVFGSFWLIPAES